MCLCSNWEFRMARRYSSEGIAHNCAHLKLSDAARLVLFHSKEKGLTQSWMFFLICLAFQIKIGGWVNLGFICILPVLWRGPMGLFLFRPREVIMHCLLDADFVYEEGIPPFTSLVKNLRLWGNSQTARLCSRCGERVFNMAVLRGMMQIIWWVWRHQS